ncbi:hypothetical protein LMIV_0649 [Listeria monocytogenes FSL J1-208]|nr:hypothetical protein LMIV_0649 [Listeria monocytogenes FSL J1-208]
MMPIGENMYFICNRTNKMATTAKISIVQKNNLLSRKRENFKFSPSF